MKSLSIIKRKLLAFLIFTSMLTLLFTQTSIAATTAVDPLKGSTQEMYLKITGDYQGNFGGSALEKGKESYIKLISLNIANPSQEITLTKDLDKVSTKIVQAIKRSEKLTLTFDFFATVAKSQVIKTYSINAKAIIISRKIEQNNSKTTQSTTASAASTIKTLKETLTFSYSSITETNSYTSTTSIKGNPVGISAKLNSPSGAISGTTDGFINYPGYIYCLNFAQTNLLTDENVIRSRNTEDGDPGEPESFASSFEIVKYLDKASPKLAEYFNKETPFSTIEVSSEAETKLARVTNSFKAIYKNAKLINREIYTVEDDIYEKLIFTYDDVNESFNAGK